MLWMLKIGSGWGHTVKSCKSARNCHSFPPPTKDKLMQMDQTHKYQWVWTAHLKIKEYLRAISAGQRKTKITYFLIEILRNREAKLEVCKIVSHNNKDMNRWKRDRLSSRESYCSHLFPHPSKCQQKQSKNHHQFMMLCLVY